MVYLPTLSALKFRRSNEALITFGQSQPPHFRNLLTADLIAHIGKRVDIDSGFFAVLFSQ
jgi:hypothetical protein